MKTFLLVILNLILVAITDGLWLLVLIVWALVKVIRKN